jgi:Domain of unknown function (DUF1905)
MDFEFTAEIWEWRGPAPYHFLTVPGRDSQDLHELSPDVTYGWGMIPVRARIGATEFETSLWPKDGGYAVPLKDAVRHAEGLALGDVVTVAFTPVASR